MGGSGTLPCRFRTVLVFRRLVLMPWARVVHDEVALSSWFSASVARILLRSRRSMKELDHSDST